MALAIPLAIKFTWMRCEGEPPCPQLAPESHPQSDRLAHTLRRSADPHPSATHRGKPDMPTGRESSRQRIDSDLGWQASGIYWMLASEPAPAPVAGPAPLRLGTLANSCSIRALVPATADSWATRMPLKMARSFDEPWPMMQTPR